LLEGRKPMKKWVIVIGAGVAGYPAALRAARLGADVTLVEKEKLEGVCLNKGYIPTKTYLRATSLLKEMKRASPSLKG
jgi:dihydrolipoamide dehydrogenase